MRTIELTTIRRWASIICGAFFLIVAVRSIYISNYIFAVLFSTLGIGLLMSKAWANRGAAFIFLLAAFIIPLGTINPFNAGDLMAEHGEIPSVSQMLIWIVPLEICILCLVWLLDPPRKRET